LIPPSLQVIGRAGAADDGYFRKIHEAPKEAARPCRFAPRDDEP
jgi:hypothetical protein